MSSTTPIIQQIHVSSTKELRPLLGESPQKFLGNLKQATWLTIEGQEQNRRRAIVTLLHANEPSGLKAIYEFIKGNLTPRTTLGIFIASVEAALHPPVFSHRHLPGEKDLNRCFSQGTSTNQTALATNFVEILKDFQPEAVIDTHNTSGHSDVFGVATDSHKPMRQICEPFTEKLVVIHQQMGTLIETDIGCPILTVEFGGFLDPNADAAALNTLEQFVCTENLFGSEPGYIQVLANPFRLQVQSSCNLEYASTIDTNAHLTMFNTIDQLNFRELDAGTSIGWIIERDLEQLIVLDTQQQNISTELFKIKDGTLQTNIPMTLFMATTDAHIAKNDCLLYLCPEISK
jgi:hypothetical protein